MSHLHAGVGRGGGAAAKARSRRRMNGRRLLTAIVITAVVLAVEVAGGFLANSLALLSDAGHVLTDLLALVLAYTALVISGRPANAKKSYGYYRVEILAALLNGALLLVIAGAILRESLGRLASPEPVREGAMLAVAAVGLVGNLLSMLALSGGRSNLNLRGAFLHVLGDTLSSLAVLGAGLVMMFTDWLFLDAACGGVIGLAIIVGAVRLLRESTDILLEACPVEIDGGRVEARIRSVEGVLDVHDLHIWSITSGMHALSGHVVVSRDHGPPDRLLGRLQELLHDEFRIAHATLQVEPEGFVDLGLLH